ncbi:MAG: hypothetical protein FJW90_01915 [Actinobacteria bacterium]|nr:hypothetical protein [Actinomycetota bacterium]
MPKSQDPANPYPDDCGTADGSGPRQLCDDLDLTEPTTAALAALLNGTEKLPTAKQKRKRKRCVAKNKRARRHGGKRRRCASLENLGLREGDDIIVDSFAQAPMVGFTAQAPQVHRAPSVDATLFFAAGQPLHPDGVAFQVPPIYGGLHAAKLLLSPSFDVQSQGYAVHVWTNSAYDETFPGYEDILELGADGIMTTSPRNLDAYLCQAGVPHPDGSSRCATKKKKRK